MDQQISHRVERTRNRHSRALLKGNTIVIRLARNLTPREEKEHVESLLRRMIRCVAREREKTVVDPFRSLLLGENHAVIRTDCGHEHVFMLQPGKRTRAKRTPDGWTIDVGPSTNSRTLHRFLWSLLCKRELPFLREYVHRINEETLRVSISSVRLGHASTQWGSCSRRGAISLNASLLFLPEHLLRYVVIHELAHRKMPSHSRKYWNVVASVDPSFQEERGELRKFRLCSL